VANVQRHYDEVLADVYSWMYGGFDSALPRFTEFFETRGIRPHGSGRAIDLGFHISFSGIVTFKNALAVKECARQVPMARMLIETDSPYLAPVPFRGKTNQPGYVKHVAEEIARLRGIPVEEVARYTTRNFFALFRHARPAP